MNLTLHKGQRSACAVNTNQLIITPQTTKRFFSPFLFFFLFFLQLRRATMSPFVIITRCFISNGDGVNNSALYASWLDSRAQRANGCIINVLKQHPPPSPPPNTHTHTSTPLPPPIFNHRQKIFLSGCGPIGTRLQRRAQR